MKIYFSKSEDIRVRGLMEVFREDNHDIYVWPTEAKLFDLVEYGSPCLIFFDSDHIELKYVNLLKKNYPNIKLALIKLGYANVDESLFNIIINTVSGENFLGHYVSKSFIDTAKNEDIYRSEFASITSHNLLSDTRAQDICKFLSHNFQFKIFGPHSFQIYCYLGNAEINNVIKSCKYFVCWDETWFHSCVASGTYPLLYKYVKNNPWEFSSYEDIKNIVTSDLGWFKELRKNIETKTYKYFYDKIKDKI